MNLKRADDVNKRFIEATGKIILLLLMVTATLCLVTWQSVRTRSEVNQKDIKLSQSYHLYTNPPLHVNIPHPNIISRHQRDTEGEICSQEKQRIVSEEGGVLHSPGHPKLYPSNADCRYQLVAKDGSNITLIITSLHIEDARNCEYDYLAIYGGSSTLSPLLGKFCGRLKDHTIQTNSSEVLLLFHSDPNYEEQGFSLQYRLDYISDCQITMTEPSGVITSPQFPNNYPDNSDCWTLISVPFGHSILIEFDILSLEVDFNCTYDYVEFFDGDSKDGDYLGRFCSPNQKSSIQSTSNAVLVHFYSDQLLSSRGYQARYSSVISPSLISSLGSVGNCLWEKEQNNGTISSPNYPEKYSSDSKCVFVLQGSPNSTISLVFEALQMEVDDNCSYDWVEIKDGLSPKSPVLGRYCGRRNESNEVTSTSNVLLVTFASDNFIEFSGFKASYFINTQNHEPKPPIKKIPGVGGIGSNCQFNETPQNATVPSGGTHSINCVPKDPITRIRWLKDDQFLGGNSQLPGLLVTKNTLWIKEMNSALVGTYTCAAVSEKGTSSIHAEITMTNDTSNLNCNIVLRKVPQDKILTEGEFTYLECLSPSDFTETSWNYNGSPMNPRSDIKALSNGILVFDSVVAGNSGIYTCVVRDKKANCEKKFSAVVTVKTRIKVEEVCGRPKAEQPNLEKPSLKREKIVGGHNSQRGAYPWQVMLWEPLRKTFCGGALLNERWIATAAHCFTYKNIDWESVLIKLGKYNQNIKENEEQETTVQEVFIHPDFNNNTFDNDIALVKLRGHIELTDFVLPICLGNQEFIESNFLSSQLRMGTVTGWGKLKEKGGRPTYLQELRMPVVQMPVCFMSTTYKVTYNMFCAGYAQEIIGDACHGDSGGPFVMEDNGVWYLVGIVSWGEGCGREGKYGFYTKVNNYHPWIKGTIRF